MEKSAETSTKSSELRLGMCEVCADKEARYACPKCEVKTCSLPCVQIHKKELQCDGQRDRTKFVPLSEMTAREFMSDYCFLEEATRFTENRKRDPGKRFTHENRRLPKFRMRTAAQKRNIRLQLLLPHFSRHRENTTFLDWKQLRLHWRVEWLFVNTPGEKAKEEEQEQEPVARSTVSLVDARCDEQTSLADLIRKYVDLEQETARDRRKLLVHHQTAGIGQLSFWLRAEGVRRSSRSCYSLQAAKSLGENLAGKTIVEFPSIFVNYEPKPPLGYDIVDSSDEDPEDEISLEQYETETGPSAKKRAKESANSDEPQDVYHQLEASFAGEDASDTSDIEGDQNG
ncbi:hypothetical protein KR009_010932 [Drosophila setifemur]|nr:hypothetical protein KR009_010932 [Drosophila setifemur]